MNRTVGYLILEDVLEDQPLVIEGCTVDAVVTVLVIQEGSEVLVDDIVIDGNMLDLEDRTGNLDYRLVSNVDEDFMSEFYSMVEELALKKAKQTPEDLWDYRLLD
jgi:hypothetical protein